MHTEELRPALQLYDAGGYAEHIIPLRAREKRPRDNDWTRRRYSRSEIQAAVEGGFGLGLRHAGVPAIDVDVTEAAIASALRVLFKDLYPRTLLRIGAAPKFLVPFRAGDSFSTFVCTLRKADGSECGKIEFRGSGQFVASGVHPRTGQPYQWEHGERTGGVELLAEHPLSALPPLTLAEINDRVLPRMQAALSSSGISVQKSGSGRSPDMVPDQPSLVAPAISLLREAVALLPNDERFDDRTAWLRVGAAIKAAAGTANDADGLAMFADWCGRWKNGENDAAYIRTTWDSLKPPFSVGFGFIEDLARTTGYNAAQREFKPVVTSPHVTNGTDASPTLPLPTIGERLVALTRSPATVFFVEALASDDDSLRARWSALRAARGAKDPLASFFQSVVLPCAKRNARYAGSDIERLTALMELELSQDAAWVSRTADEQTLLLRAALVLCADKAALIAVDRASAGERITVGTKSRANDLIGGLLPSRGLGFFFGKPGAGKSFLALSLAAKVAAVRDPDPLAQPPSFLGREVRSGTVYYFASEDAEGIATRAAAYAAAYGLDLRHLHVFGRVPALRNFESAMTFVLDALGRMDAPDAPAPALIVYDVWAAAVDGKENDTEDAAAATSAVKCINRILKAATIAVHHAPRSEDRMRGSVVYDAEADCLLQVSQSSGGIGLSIEKNKRGPGGGRFTFHLREGVLQDGGVLAAAPASNIEADARDLAQFLYDRATVSAGVAEREFRKDAKAEFGPRFSEAKKLSRAIQRAEEAKFIKFDRAAKRYFRGEVTPPPAAASEPVDLSGVL